MATYSTAEIAARCGVHKRTLLEWLYKRRLREPRRISVGGQAIRIWSERDLQRAVEFARLHYRKAVAEVYSSRKSPIGKHGVLTLSGFVRVRVQNGHLEIEDGVGLERRKFRLPRVEHGLKRLVVIGNDGYLTLAALQWLADQDASLTFLDRNGKVLFVSGPTAPSNARLRRAQALAVQNGTALEISRELIDAKLSGQEAVARGQLRNAATADVIARSRERLCVHVFGNRPAAPVRMFPQLVELRFTSLFIRADSRVNPTTRVHLRLLLLRVCSWLIPQGALALGTDSRSFRTPWPPRVTTAEAVLRPDHDHTLVYL